MLSYVKYVLSHSIQIKYTLPYVKYGVNFPNPNIDPN